METCPLCNEEMSEEDLLDTHLIATHRECLLRDALGGIGHLVAHDHWCRRMHDPDAGFTYRESALLIAAAVRVLGIDATVERSHHEPLPH